MQHDCLNPGIKSRDPRIGVFQSRNLEIETWSGIAIPTLNVFVSYIVSGYFILYSARRLVVAVLKLCKVIVVVQLQFFDVYIIINIRLFTERFRLRCVQLVHLSS